MLILNVFKSVQQRKGTKKDGTEFEIQFQEAEILQENRRPRVVEISVPRQGRYDDGLYTVSSESFRPNNFDSLEMRFPTLTPLEEALKIGDRAQKNWKSGVQNPWKSLLTTHNIF